jgi:urea carboxylase-associated protein 2
MSISPSIADGRIVFEETIPGGAMWSHVLKPHQMLRLTDLEGGANVGALFYNRDHWLDRLNLPDTLKAQHTAKLTTGHVLFSDMGHVLCSITADTCGWHDPLAGHSTSALVQKKYGTARFQQQRNDFYRNARDQFLIELGKWGLGKADLVANVNLFSKVTVDHDGRMHFEEDHASPGAYVDLRAEMNVLIVLNTCQHPMDPFPEYRPRPVKLTVWNADPPAPDDICRNSSPENERGFMLTEALFRWDATAGSGANV